MSPADLLLLVMLAALTLYAVFGGADFGVGVWEFTSAMQSSQKERDDVYRAIGPVWEANHVWLIFVIVILVNAFPPAFAALSRALWLPLLVALAGIVFRGASYVFRAYGKSSEHVTYTWEAVFAVASTATPFCLGAAAGAIATGHLEVTEDGGYTGDILFGWLSSLAVFSGFYSVMMCAYLAAVYLVREAEQRGDEELRTQWRRRALSVGVWMGLLSLGGLLFVMLEAPDLTAGFRSRGWPFVLLSVASGFWSLVSLSRERFTRAVVAAASAVAAVIWGWGVSQYPHIVPPQITSTSAQAPDNVLWTMLAVIVIGALFLFPALGYLFLLFKADQRSDQSITSSVGDS